jgi:hypothetical protein
MVKLTVSGFALLLLETLTPLVAIRGLPFIEQTWTSVDVASETQSLRINVMGSFPVGLVGIVLPLESRRKLLDAQAVAPAIGILPSFRRVTRHHRHTPHKHYVERTLVPVTLPSHVPSQLTAGGHR